MSSYSLKTNIHKTNDKDLSLVEVGEDIDAVIAQIFNAELELAA